jgi:hypothetical protein
MLTGFSACQKRKSRPCGGNASVSANARNVIAHIFVEIARDLPSDRGGAFWLQQTAKADIPPQGRDFRF